ncbi:universal stress protein [Planctomicrobium sp. SH664]|uniref:universal stress protein n=1 Tax=Planctomicrobium sp. SH664 TaxID=3448125 RepID=UPI003F5C2586
MKILLATDGSEHSLTAEKFLEKFPWGQQPDVILIHVAPIPMADVSHVYEEYCKEGEKLLQEAALRCANWARRVERRMLSGNAAQHLVTTAEVQGADLLVLGARGLGGVGRFLLGSTSEKVAKLAPCSVLIVRPCESSAGCPLRRVLIATDESGPAQAAARRFGRFPLGKDCEITVMTVMPDVSSYYSLTRSAISDSTFEVRRQQFEQSLQELATELQPTGASTKVVVRESINPAQEILEVAKDHKSELIVMGNTGLSGWERLLLGSVSLRVLQHAPCSVWIGRSPAGAEG